MEPFRAWRKMVEKEAVGSRHDVLQGFVSLFFECCNADWASIW